MYEKVVAEIRAQYTIGYVSTNEQTDGAWRKVEIKSTAKDSRDISVRARKGYFGPVQEAVTAARQMHPRSRSH